MNLLYQSAFIEALGWSLVDSLWQTGTLWVLYVLLTGKGKKFTSSGRYLIAVGALTLSCGWFSGNLLYNYLELLDGRQVRSATFYIKQHLPGVLPASGFLEASIPFLSAVYIGLLGFFSLKFLIAFVKSRGMLRSGIYESSDYISAVLGKLMARTGIGKKVKIRLSDTIHSALTLGFIKPVILLPVAVVNQLSLAQTEAIIAHELFHIRRNDYLVNILMNMAELVLFFNPFARMLHGIISKEREHCCDDEVLALGYSSWEYSESLYLLGASSLMQNRFALALSGNNRLLLLDRIKRMLKYRQPKVPVVKPICLFLLFLGIATFGKKKSSGMKDQEISSGSFIYSAGAIVKEEKPVLILEMPADLEMAADLEKPAVHFLRKTVRIKLSTGPIAAAPAAPLTPPVSQDKKDLQNEAVVLKTLRITRVFVSGKPKQIEFTLIETTPVVPESPNAGKLMPYVPASTFYFPESKDTTAPKEVKKSVNI